MNAFIPVLIAVLLAEFGGRATLFAKLPRLSFAAVMLGLAVGIAAFGGLNLAPTMPPRARSLLLGVALILTGFGQFGKPPTGSLPATLTETFAFVWRSSAPFLAFAFSVWKAAPVSAAAGAFAGIAGAAASGALLISGQAMACLRRAAGMTLVFIGTYTALWALRLIA